jgi:ribose transport system permease protein
MTAVRDLARGAWDSTGRFRPVLLLLIVMFPAFAILQGAFLTQANLESMLVNSAVLWIVAMGMTFVLLSGGFDLSVAAIAALSGIFMAKALEQGIPGGVVVVLAILLGVLVGGLVNGLLVGRGGLSVFVVTLASMISISGVVDLWSNSKSFYVYAPVAAKIGTADLLGVPMPIWIMAAVFLAALYVQSRTFFGRDVYAIGGNQVAARLAGIRVPGTLIAVYALMGGCAGLAGVVAVGRIGAAVPQVNNTLPLEAIAAVLLGGTALSGGFGGVGGTALGVLFIAVLDNGLAISGVSNDWQSIVTGVILVVAVASDRMRFRRAEKGATVAADPDHVQGGADPAPEPPGAMVNAR